MEITNLIDLSFLAKEEQESIEKVLKRDKSLRRREEKRIRRIKQQKLDQRCLKLQTGEWFEELKAKRFVDYPSATDLLKCVLQQKEPGSEPSRRMSWLSKIPSLKMLQVMFADPPNTFDLWSRCPQIEEKSIVNTSECTTISIPEEELSITQILKDLEIILDLEIKNLNSSEDNTDTNGLENAMFDQKLPADNSLHQESHNQEPQHVHIFTKTDRLTQDLDCTVETGFHASKIQTEPQHVNSFTKTDSLTQDFALETGFNASEIQTGLMDTKLMQASLSTRRKIIPSPDKDLPVTTYYFEKDMQYGKCNLEIPPITDSALSTICSEQQGPFCSSPYLSKEFLFSDECHRYDNYLELITSSDYKLHPNHPRTDSDPLYEHSLDTENTLEPPTIIALSSSILTEDTLFC